MQKKKEKVGAAWKQTIIRFRKRRRKKKKKREKKNPRLETCRPAAKKKEEKRINKGKEKKGKANAE